MMKVPKDKLKHRVIEDYRPGRASLEFSDYSLPTDRPTGISKPLPPSRSSILFGEKSEKKEIPNKPSREKPHKKKID